MVLFLLPLLTGCIELSLQDMRDFLPAEEVNAIQVLMAPSGATLDDVGVRADGKWGWVFDDLTDTPRFGDGNAEVWLKDGAITQLYVHNIALSDTAPLAKLKHLEKLTLSENGLHHPPACGPDTVLGSITLGENPLEGLGQLSGCTALRSLTLKDVDLKGLLSTMPALPEMDGLNLENNRLTSLEGFPTLPKLSYLWLKDNEITSFDGFPSQPELRGLTVYRGHLESLDTLVDQPRLDSLTVTENNLKDVDGLGRLENLRVLDLSDNDIADLGPLEELEWIQGLHRLNIENNPGQEAAKVWLRKLPKGVVPSAESTDGACGSRFGCFKSNDPSLADVEIPPPPNPFVEKLPPHTGAIGRNKFKIQNSAVLFSSPKIDARFEIEEVTGAPRVSFRAGGSLSGVPSVRVKVQVESGVLRVHMPYFTVYQYVEARPGEPAIIEGRLERYSLSSGELYRWQIPIQAPEGPARGVVMEISSR